jgi:hypothetical protein
MSNHQSAKHFIAAELKHAKAGAAYYKARVDALEKALTQLRDLDAVSEKPAGKKQKKKSKGKKLTKSKKAKASKASSKVPDLPATGAEYWMNLITDEPKTAPELFRIAIARLGFLPTIDQVKKLGNRQTFTLNTLVKQKKIQDSGSGRERRFFRG